MRRGRFVAMLALLLGLGAYVYFVELRGGEKKEQAEEESKKVFSFKTDDVIGLHLAHGSESVRLMKAEKAWKITEPVAATPEADAVERLLGSLQSMRIAHDLGKPADVAPFNLAAPPLVIEVVLAAGKPQPSPLAVGDDAPTGGGAYAREGPEGRVVIVSGAEGARGATLFSLRDKTFFKFDPARLDAIVLERGKDVLSLARVDGRWGILSPSRTPAEDSTIADLSSALERLTVTEFVEEKPGEASLAAHGLAPADLAVRLHGGEWKTDPELRFGHAEQGGLFAVHPGTGALVKVSDSILPKLKSSLADLRRKDLMPIQSWDLEGLRITGLTPTPLELRRKGDKEWNRVSPSPAVLPDDEVDLLLRNLTDLKAEEFRDNVSAKGPLGLEPPKARLEFWKQGEENKSPAVLRVGKESGKKIFFQDEKWPAVALADAAVWARAAEQAGKVARETPKPPEAPQTAPAAAAPKPDGK